jgi:ADP-ribose pyrophosphatase
MKKFPWDIVRSRYIVDDRWLKLRADDCLTSSGKSVSPYYVLEYPPWVSVVALTPDKDIVVIKQYRHGIRQFILEIPGGAVEEEDDSIVAAARRELKEETGYQAGEFTEVGNISANPVNHTNDIYFFLAFNARKVSEPTPEFTEQIEVLQMP